MKNASILSSIVVLMTVFWLTACSNAASETGNSKNSYQVSFQSSNVVGEGLVVQINGGNDLEIPPGEGTYTFPLKLENGDFFEVSIHQNPNGPNQVCEFNKLSGKVGPEVELNLTLTCTLVSYDVGGRLNVSLASISEMALTVNGEPTTLVVDGNNNFQFSDPFDDHSVLTIAFTQVPELHSCTVNDADSLTVTVDGAEIDDLVIACIFDGFEPIVFDASKTDPFTTPSINNYLTGFDLNGTASITAWNNETVARYGSVDYNGDGTFTYTPGPNAQSGQDSFSFRVVDSQGGDPITHFVTLNIQPGWGQQIVFVPPTNNYATLQYGREIGGNYFAGYTNASYLLRKLDQQNHQWLAEKTLPSNIAIEEQGSIKYFSVETNGTESILTYQEYITATDTLSDPISLTTIGLDNASLRGLVTDENGNMFLFISRSYTDPQNFYITEYYGKYYSAADQIWHTEKLMLDGSNGILQQNNVYLVNGRPVVIIRHASISPVLWEYDTAGQTWNNTVLSTTDEIVQGGWVYSYQSEQNADGDVMVFWKQRVIDSQTAVDSWFSKASIYRAGIGLETDITLDKIPLTEGLEVYMTELNNSDFLLMSRPYIRDQQAAGYPEGEIYSHYYSTQTNQFVIATSPIVTGHVGSYLNVRPMVDLGENGDAVFTWQTQDESGNDIHYFKALPFRGNWSARQEVNTTPSQGSPITFFDQAGNYYNLFKQANTRGGSYGLRKFDFTSNTNSSIVPADDSSETKGSAGIHATNTDRLFIHWSKQIASGDYEICMREISLDVGLSESNLSPEECTTMVLPNTGTYNLQLAETATGNRHLVVSARGIVYYANNIGGAWGRFEEVFSPDGTPDPYDSYYNKIELHPYGNGDHASLIVEHVHNNYSQSSTTERSIIGFLYN